MVGLRCRAAQTNQGGAAAPPCQIKTPCEQSRGVFIFESGIGLVRCWLARLSIQDFRAFAKFLLLFGCECGFRNNGCQSICCRKAQVKIVSVFRKSFEPFPRLLVLPIRTSNDKAGQAEFKLPLVSPLRIIINGFGESPVNVDWNHNDQSQKNAASNFSPAALEEKCNGQYK